MPRKSCFWNEFWLDEALTGIVGDAVVWVEVADLLGLHHELVPRAAVVGVVQHVVEHGRRHVRVHRLQLRTKYALLSLSYEE